MTTLCILPTQLVDRLLRNPRGGRLVDGQWVSYKVEIARMLKQQSDYDAGQLLSDAVDILTAEDEYRFVQDLRELSELCESEPFKAYGHDCVDPLPEVDREPEPDVCFMGLAPEAIMSESLSPWLYRHYPAFSHAIKLTLAGDRHFMPAMTAQVDAYKAGVVATLKRLKRESEVEQPAAVVGHVNDNASAYMSDFHLNQWLTQHPEHETKQTYCQPVILLAEHQRAMAQALDLAATKEHA